MNSGIVCLVTVGLIANVFGCSSSGWSSWINEYTPSKIPFPSEPSDGITGGDLEDMNATQRAIFCAPGHGSISSIDCVTTNGTNYITAQGSSGLICRIPNGFKCENRLVVGGICLDYKIRFHCECSNPLPTVRTSTVGSVTQYTTHSGKNTASGMSILGMTVYIVVFSRAFL